MVAALLAAAVQQTADFVAEQASVAVADKMLAVAVESAVATAVVES